MTNISSCGDTAIITAAGFAQRLEKSTTIEKIEDFAKEKWMDFFAVEQPGIYEGTGKFSFSAMVNSILSSLTVMYDYDTIYMIPNSMTSPAFLDAYAGLHEEFRKKIQKIIFLSPVFDVKKTIAQKNNGMMNFSWAFLEWLAKQCGIDVNIDAFLMELEKYDFQYSKEILVELGAKWVICMNKNDSLIHPNTIKNEVLDQKNTIIYTKKVAGDTENHSIDFDTLKKELQVYL